MSLERGGGVFEEGDGVQFIREENELKNGRERLHHCPYIANNLVMLHVSPEFFLPSFTKCDFFLVFYE